MPRVTFNQYLDQRAFLRLTWEEFDQLYSLLPTHQQWQLHRYYQPLSKHTDEQLKQYRAHVSQVEPAVPAQAGRLYAKLNRVYETAIKEARARQQHSRPERSRPSGRKTRAAAGSTRITVRAIARPEPDLKKLSLALLEVAKQRAQEHKQ
jgi:hypothetical protein